MLVAPIVFLAIDRERITASTIYLSVILISMFIVVYFVVFELLFGHTIGKRIFNFKVITTNGGSPTVYQILIRNFLRVIDHIFLIGGVIVVLSKRKQRLGDLLSKTMVKEM